MILRISLSRALAAVGLEKLSTTSTASSPIMKPAFESLVADRGIDPGPIFFNTNGSRGGGVWAAAGSASRYMAGQSRAQSLAQAHDRSPRFGET